MRQVEIDALRLPLARPFAISRGTRNATEVVRVSIEENGFVGWGECTPTAHYQQSCASVVEQLESVRPLIAEGLSREQLQQILPHGSARNVLDCALWRLDAAQQGRSLCEYASIPIRNSLITAQTLGLDSVAAMAQSAAEAVASGAKLLKIKLDAEQVIEKVAAICQNAPNAQLIIDANEAWASLALPDILAQLSEYGIEMVEQPLPAEADKLLALFDHPLPVCADESCHTSEDIKKLSDRYDMVNIKLDKCGGLTEALKMVEVAKACQMRVMVGCMLGSSMAMEAALPVALQAEFVDLDGPLWLAADSAPYLCYHRGQIELQ
ncbi:N-acetyl-D-Glu racemase DgcA [Celerinatantimonas diazotrophica]|uniref:Dipeptide epimerase n=1 Tax=Celerinatantimonas diazotrophica TaxID=412034 RepID=A0A4R1J804_9GAMM|nr:N-acetyl-D-Glu racemase DgcA [Celerinatantimonas diazotrophica]TCK46434.1 L-alanine-DL-glutamate epimerase-like enolase superfamily enzyme [Celerinatantimonas diazotrophica]CAG9295189.1 L-Ala-D/L-Glu epimerase [Celerinatantimonas diazotrophica]